MDTEVKKLTVVIGINGLEVESRICDISHAENAVQLVGTTTSDVVCEILSDGYDVVIHGSLKKADRVNALHHIKSELGESVSSKLVLLLTPPELAMRNLMDYGDEYPVYDCVQARLKRFEPPHKSEGWDSIEIIPTFVSETWRDMILVDPCEPDDFFWDVVKDLPKKQADLLITAARYLDTPTYQVALDLSSSTQNQEFILEVLNLLHWIHSEHVGLRSDVIKLYSDGFFEYTDFLERTMNKLNGREYDEYL